MIVRLGYVAMSTIVSNASPSRTMTYTNFAKITDRDAALRKLERLATENLHNTLRLLRHNRAHDIQVYRFSSKLIPLFGHNDLLDWQPIPDLTDAFVEIGAYVKKHSMRTSFHPDHFTVLSTPREDVLASSIADLDRHVHMLEAMGLDESVKCNIHIGGAYGDKKIAGARFIEQFLALPERIRRRMTLENDDKTFNTLETLTICEEVGVPMVLDIHHHAVNPPRATIESMATEHAIERDAEHTTENMAAQMTALWPRIQDTWTKCSGFPDLPPKIHVSSPKNNKSIRSHADYVDPAQLITFLRDIAPITPRLDVMLEAKMKDSALIQLIEDLKSDEHIKLLDQASFELII